MECNKEEAIRAKSIAENKMQAKDFVSAQKIVLKARQLFPELENVSQMLTVCEVHNSAGIKINGEMDWYSILQVEPTADELSIKKQYRKLALLLHPDKNKFPGSEAAFKFIGEAHRILSDREKRSLVDMKRGYRNVPLRQPTQQPSKTTDTRNHSGVSKHHANNFAPQFNGATNQQQQSSCASTHTFWTICSFCGIRYQYYQTILNKLIRCQSCLKPFIAYDLNAQAVPSMPNPGNLYNHTGIPRQSFQGTGAHMTGQRNYFANAPRTGFRVNPGGGSTSSQPCPGAEDRKMENEIRTGNEDKFGKVKRQEVNRKAQVAKPSVQNARQKRSREVVVESSDSDGNGSDVVIEEVGGSNWATDHSPRRSTRQKQSVSQNRGGVDDEDFSIPSAKRSKKGGKSYENNQNGDGSFVRYSNGVQKRTNGVHFKENSPNGLQEREQYTGNGGKLSKDGCSKASRNVDLGQNTSVDADPLSYPDPEFFDFGKDRDPSKFAVDQIWAVYDNLDGMPRFYALIRNVYGPDFKLRFTWLEHEPIGNAEKEWSAQDLPVACGSFRLGKSEKTEEQLMFSHLMTWAKGKKKSSYKIFPRKGEVWALFKGWNTCWSSDAEKHRVYEYEVVEVLSDYDESSAVEVVHLVKINGFVSLFMRAADMNTALLQIPPSEILRFSHKVPSYRMTGEEREGIPAGSIELDSASMPSDFAKTFPSISLGGNKARVENLDNVSEGPCIGSSGEKHAADTTKMNGMDVHENQKDNDASTSRLNTGCERQRFQEGSTSEARKHADSVRNCTETETVPKYQVDSNGERVDAGESSIHNINDEDDSPMSSPSRSYEYPDPEFHNFEKIRSREKFERGQIWALYSDLDGFPKYYGLIGKVECDVFKVHVTWLQACPVSKEEKQWLDKLPISCGEFSTINESCVFDTMDTFSHQVQAAPAGKKGHYHIHPNTGEVWALYKNWSFAWSLKDLQDSDYDVVEVISRSDSVIKVLMLAKVDGYRAVFTSERKGVAASALEIPVSDHMKFSHQIPAFRLTEEMGGKLRGSWELDPASVPQLLLIVDSE